MTIGGRFANSPGARVPASRMEAPFRPRASLSLDPSLAVKVPVETSRHGVQTGEVELPSWTPQPHALDRAKSGLKPMES